MLDSLRSRFIVSHALPLLLIIPLMGIALVYLLETQVLLPSLASDTLGEAVLVAKLAADDPSIWSNPSDARTFLQRVQNGLNARIMLIDQQGRLIGSTDPADDSRVGQSVAYAGMSQVLAGQNSVHTDYTQHPNSEAADVFVPVFGPNHQVIGVVRLTHQLGSVFERFTRLRAFIGAVLGAALVMGAIIGFVLALNLQRPLERLTQSVNRLSGGQELTPLPEQGPREVRVLLHSFNAMSHRLLTVEEARRQLLSNLIHELGTPLSALNSGVHALRGGAVERVELRQELLEGMEYEVRHLRRLLDDLARLYDRVLGTMNLDLEPLAVEEWLPRVLATWRQAAQAKGLNWTADIPVELPPVQADADRLAQVLGNLLSNAIKYTKKGGSISIAAQHDGDRICICVADNGVGIPQDEQALIFQPFYRGRSGGRFADGMGLGLTIARDLAVAHGGELEVESTPGQGSRFRLWLPIYVTR